MVVYTDNNSIAKYFTQTIIVFLTKHNKKRSRTFK